MNKRNSIVKLIDTEGTTLAMKSYFLNLEVGDFFINDYGDLYMKISKTHVYCFSSQIVISGESSSLETLCDVEITYKIKRRENQKRIKPVEVPERVG